MSDDSNKNSLDIIEQQIKHLRARNQEELSYENVKKLSELVKTRNLILERPTEINEIIEDSKYNLYEVECTLRRHQKSQKKVRDGKVHQAWKKTPSK